MLDYQALALSRLTSQFSEAVKLRGLVGAMVAAFSRIEDDADLLASSRWISTASGAQLDGCGAIVGELRNGRSDEAYRLAIRFRVFVNTSGATPSDLIEGLRYVTTPIDSQYLESYPATALLFTDGFDIDNTIQQTMQSLAPAGISTVPVAVSYGERPLRFAKESNVAELFVNDDQLTANDADLQVAVPATAGEGVSCFGGAIPSDLELGSGLIETEFGLLVVYNPNSLITLGNYHLTGVYQ